MPSAKSAITTSIHSIVLMHEGKLTRGQLQAWALNRYYYQSHIPIKDAADSGAQQRPAFRIAWRKRILDHDGDGKHPGGIEKWLKLVEATGLPREQAIHGDGILPATRYAVQAYVLLVSRTSHLEAVASSLTELFSRNLIALRMDRMREHYPWLVPGLEYFKGRLTQAPEDAEFALSYCVKHAQTREQQELAHAAITRQVRYSVGATRCALFFIRESRLAAPRRVPAREGILMKPELTATPRLAPGVRLNEKTEQPRMLLMPERALRLIGPSLEIVQLCDGKHTVQQIAEKLHALYSKAEPQRITDDLLGYLALLHDERALDF